MTDLFKEVCKIQAIHLKRLGIPLPEPLKKIEAEMVEEEKLETEIKLVEAEYTLSEMEAERPNAGVSNSIGDAG